MADIVFRGLACSMIYVRDCYIFIPFIGIGLPRFSLAGGLAVAGESCRVGSVAGVSIS